MHALYRGQAGADTARARTDHLIAAARQALATPDAAAGAAPRVPSLQRPRLSTAVLSAEPSPDATGAWTAAESAAVTKCVMAWLPMGAPSSAAPDSRCMPPGKELIPTWRERETAREAVKKVPTSP